MTIESTNFSEILPLEISRYIFSYLSNEQLAKIAHVCKKWKEIASHDQLWKGLALSLKITPIEGKIKAQVCEKLNNKTKITVSDKRELQSQIIRFFHEAKDKELFVLHYSSDKFKDAHLFAILKKGQFAFPSDLHSNFASSIQSSETLMIQSLSEYNEKGMLLPFSKADRVLSITGKDDADMGVDDLPVSKLNLHHKTDHLYSLDVVHITGKCVHLMHDNDGQPGYFGTSFGSTPPKTECVYSFQISTTFFEEVKNILYSL